MKVFIEVVPAEKMRIAFTVGDWFITRKATEEELEDFMGHGGAGICIYSPSFGEEPCVYAKSWDDADTLRVRVAAMGDWRHEQLVAMHEYAEAMMCRHNGISPSDVDRFDQEYERNHKNDNTEPGDDPSAPYYRPHIVSTLIENIMIGELEVNNDLYDEALDEAWKRTGHGKGGKE